MQLIPAKYRRCFYYTCKENFCVHKSNKSKWRYRLNLFILLLTIPSLILEISTMATDYRWEWWHNEPYTNYLYRNKQFYDPYMVAIALLFVLFCFYFRYLLYHLPTNTKHWQRNYEMYAIQQDWYYKCVIKDERKLSAIYNKKYKEIITRIKNVKFLCIAIPKVFIKCCTNLDIFLRMENVDKAKFFSKPQPIRPNLSIKNRSRIIVVLILLDKINSVLLVGYVLVSVVVSMISFLVAAFPSDASFPWYSICLLVVIAFIIFDYISQIIMLALFMNTWSAIEFYSTAEQCKEMYNKLGQVIKQFKRVGALPVWYRRVLHQILLDHTRSCVMTMTQDRAMGEKLSFSFLLTNIPVNIYVITKMTLLKSYPIDRAICLAFGVFQVLAYCILITIADQGKNHHAIGKYIPNLQAIMKPSSAWLWYKLKFNDLYKRLSVGPKYVLNIGPGKEYTRFALIEVAFIYVGYLFMAFEQIFEARSNN